MTMTTFPLLFSWLSSSCSWGRAENMGTYHRLRKWKILKISPKIRHPDRIHSTAPVSQGDSSGTSRADQNRLASHLTCLGNGCPP
jgi:hypothetical protein